MGLFKASVSTSDQISIKKTTIFRVGYMVMPEYDKVGYATTTIFASEQEASFYAQPGEQIVQVEVKISER